MANPGNKSDAGFGVPLNTVDLMIDKRYQPSLQENLALGVGKAHRSVVYSHYEYRNFNRGAEMSRGIVK